MSQPYLMIKGFEELQHYKDWQPPWIKLYNRLLDDYHFLQMSEVAQIHLVKLWLLASRHGNRIPNDLVYISRAIQAKSPVDLDEMIVAGFVIPTDTPPKLKRRKRNKIGRYKKSRPILDKVYKKSTPETETETETEKNKPTASASDEAGTKPKHSRKPREGWVTTFGTDWEEVMGGVPPYAIIGAAIKPLAKKLGVEPLAIRTDWRAFLKGPDGKYGAHYFAQRYGQYSKPPEDTRKVSGVIPISRGPIQW